MVLGLNDKLNDNYTLITSLYIKTRARHLGLSRVFVSLIAVCENPAAAACLLSASLAPSGIVNLSLLKSLIIVFNTVHV